MNRLWMLTLAFVMITGIAACGVGSDSSGGVNQETTPYTVSTTELNFSARVGESAPATASFTVTLSESDDEQPRFTWEGQAISDVFPYWGYTSADVGVTVPDPDSLGIGTHTGTITIETYEQIRTVTVNYQVSGGLPEVSDISPYAVSANAAGSVVISGSGFLGGAEPTVSFGSTVATAVEVVDDATLIATYPAMAEGNYAVSVVGDTHFPSSLSLHVVTAVSYSETVIPTTGYRYKLVHDPMRNALYTVNWVTGEVERYTYNAATLAWNREVLVISGVWDLDISTDGELLLAVGDNVIYMLDPDADTLTADSFVTHDFMDDYSTCKDYFRGIRVTSNGSALLLTGLKNCSGYSEDYWLDISTGTMAKADNDFGILKVSGDRHRIYEEYFYDWQYLDFTSKKFVDDGADTDIVALDGDGSHYVGMDAVGYAVFDSKDHTKLGSFTDDTYNTGLVMSYDGTHIYKFNSTSNVLTRYEVDAKDASGVFQATGSHTLFGDIGSGSMIVSHDGGTLFIKGLYGIAVVNLTSF